MSELTYEDVLRKLKKKSNNIRTISPSGLAKYGIQQANDIDLFLPNTGASTVASMGSAQTGKSTLMVHVMKKYYSHNPYIDFLYSRSLHIPVLQTLQFPIVARPTFNKSDEDMIKLQAYLNKNTGNHYRFVNFFDDIIDNKYSKTVDDLCLIYRNSMISTWLSTQYPYLISKKNRCNVNSFVLFRFYNMQFLEEVIKAYLRPYFIRILGVGASMQEMVKLYNELTEDHGAIYLVPQFDKIQFFKLKL